MSNARIAGRLSALADEIELGQVSVAGFADQILGHAEALEGIPYGQIKEVQLVQAQLRIAIERGQGPLVDLHRLGDWLRAWVARVPAASA